MAGRPLTPESRLEPGHMTYTGAYYSNVRVHGPHVGKGPGTRTKRLAVRTDGYPQGFGSVLAGFPHRRVPVRQIGEHVWETVDSFPVQHHTEQENIP
jgi:hypothetical protein